MNKIESTILKKNRYYVRIKNDKIYPRANYIWMKFNPSFQKIPKGYVIHHLDCDPTNDDISNLVLMHKFHHVAYHLKHKEIISEVEIDDCISKEQFFRTPYYPNKRPRVYHRKDSGKWIIICRIGNNMKSITRYRGDIFKTKEQAESAIDKIWPNGWDDQKAAAL